MLSAVAADHVQRPRNQGSLENAAHYRVSCPKDFPTPLPPRGGPYLL